MEKRSRRRIRDLVALAAFQGLSQNEIGCARISMMARSTNAPFKGRIQKRKTNHLQIFTFGLQRTGQEQPWHLLIYQSILPAGAREAQADQNWGKIAPLSSHPITRHV